MLASRYPLPYPGPNLGRCVAAFGGLHQHVGFSETRNALVEDNAGLDGFDINAVSGYPTDCFGNQRRRGKPIGIGVDAIDDGLRPLLAVGIAGWVGDIGGVEVRVGPLVVLRQAGRPAREHRAVILVALALQQPALDAGFVLGQHRIALHDIYLFEQGIGKLVVVDKPLNRQQRNNTRFGQRWQRVGGSIVEDEPVGLVKDGRIPLPTGESI